jgi:predicted nucleotidyltransferase
LSSDLEEPIVSLLGRHRAVRSVELVGSRARGRGTERSDWDFRVESDNFDALASELVTQYDDFPITLRL